MADQQQRKKKENILELSVYLDKKIRVKFSGGREVSGLLRGYDPLTNLVLDETVEYIRDADGIPTEETRSLGLMVARGTAVILIAPMDGYEEIANPFVQEED
eukprot:Nk52_evm100s2192 gene=Nk52_evmTU100s2192